MLITGNKAEQRNAGADNAQARGGGEPGSWGPWACMREEGLREKIG